MSRPRPTATTSARPSCPRRGPTRTSIPRWPASTTRGSWRSRPRAGPPTTPSSTASRSRRTCPPASSSEPGPHRCGTPPASSDRADRPAAEGMYTVAELADRGIHPMTDDEIRAVTVGRTVRSVNLITGFEATLHYGADGNRSLMGLGDRPVVTRYEIRDGRRIETTLLGERMSVALFSSTGAPWEPGTTRPDTSTTKRSQRADGRVQGARRPWCLFPRAPRTRPALRRHPARGHRPGPGTQGAHTGRTPTAQRPARPYGHCPEGAMWVRRARRRHGVRRESGEAWPTGPPFLAVAAKRISTQEVEGNLSAVNASRIVRLTCGNRNRW